MSYFTLLPEEIVEHIIDLKCGTLMYRQDKKQWESRMVLVQYELDRWSESKFSISFLKSNYTQRKRGAAFKNSLKTGPPKMTCHVGLFHSREEISYHLWYLIGSNDNDF